MKFFLIRFDNDFNISTLFVFISLSNLSNPIHILLQGAALTTFDCPIADSRVVFHNVHTLTQRVSDNPVIAVIMMETASI